MYEGVKKNLNSTGLTSQNELGYTGESRIQDERGQLVLSAAQG